MLVRYSAEQMPTEAIERIQRDTLTNVNEGEMPLGDALRIINLLLTISLRKLSS
jgi:hypothetical protein